MESNNHASGRLDRLKSCGLQVETKRTRKPVCPSCGHEQDTWDMDLSREVFSAYCESCDKLMEIHVHTVVTYSTNKRREE